VGGGWGVGVEVVEERCLPSLGEDTLISSRSRRMMVVFLAFLSPSSRALSVSTSTSNCKDSRNQQVSYKHKATSHQHNYSQRYFPSATDKRKASEWAHNIP
jgi:hypothetical protein